MRLRIILSENDEKTQIKRLSIFAIGCTVSVLDREVLFPEEAAAEANKD